ncbi:MAG: hypothetical protein ACFFD7_08215 [Candidatus Thorarchaeota archaeon]
MTDKIKDQLIEMLIEHSRAIYSIISDMGVFYVTWAENSKSNRDLLEKKVTKLKFDVEEAASIKNRTIKTFSEVLTFGSGDWAILIHRMNNLSNVALRFIDLLRYIDLNNVDPEMKDLYHRSINKILEMEKLINESIKLLRENPRNIIININMIHELGNYTETVFHQFLNYLYKDKKLEIRDLLIIRDTVVTLEQFVDKVNHIAEIIRVLNYE